MYEIWYVWCMGVLYWFVCCTTLLIKKQRLAMVMVIKYSENNHIYIKQ